MSVIKVPIFRMECTFCKRYAPCFEVELGHHVLRICLDCFEKLMEYVELVKHTLMNIEKLEYITVTADTLDELSTKLNELSKECKSVKVITVSQSGDKWKALVEVVKPWKNVLRELAR